MGFRFALARAVGATSTWALKNMLRRPAANFPGKAGLVADPRLIADLRPRLRDGSVVVVGTNGKTTVTNLLADALESSGKSVACNRTGANLDSGVATALLHVKSADWGVFESDELWLAQIIPQLEPDLVVLLNLFRDQLDRMGEIDHIQASIADALTSSPKTALAYNADDPLCQIIADRVSNRRIPFGIDEDLGLAQNTVADASMCQRCDALLDYAWRQYGQLGSFACPNCSFRRKTPIYAACKVKLSAQGSMFVLRRAEDGTIVENPAEAPSDTPLEICVNAPFSQPYMLYNMLAVFAAADCCGIPLRQVDEAVHLFAPENGRLQHYEIGGRHILLNLAKNPTGFNQNLRIVRERRDPKAVAFFINDKEADGHDVSWLWDVDFQELADAGSVMAYAGGIRRNDMQVRLKYAGIDAELVDGAGDFLAKTRDLPPDASLYLIANYTALPDVKAELDRMAVQLDESGSASAAHPGAVAPNLSETPTGHRRRGDALDDCRPHSPMEDDASGQRQERPFAQRAPARTEHLTIVHLYPELLNLYGDGGNVIVLAQRARKRGIKVDIVRVEHGRAADLADADIVFLGGGPDREQHLASLDLIVQATQLREYVEDDGVLLAICGGYQILGREWLLGDESVAGLGIVDMTTKRAKGGSYNRLVGNIALRSPLATLPVIGYENHAGRTFLGSGCEPFGHVIGKCGKGNNDTDKSDGVLYRNVIGTYLHGPLLAKNPEVADWLILRALERRAAKEGRTAPAPAPLDDTAERAANGFMRKILGVRR